MISLGSSLQFQFPLSFSQDAPHNSFFPFANERKILQDNPFKVLEVQGVGRSIMVVIETGVALTRHSRFGDAEALRAGNSRWRRHGEGEIRDDFD